MENGTQSESESESETETATESELPHLRRTVPFPAKLHSIRPEDRYAPSAALKREIWKRDEGKCTRCESKHALEIDHILPFACGGKTTAENLRLLCRSCNQAAARKTFG